MHDELTDAIESLRRELRCNEEITQKARDLPEVYAAMVEAQAATVIAIRNLQIAQRKLSGETQPSLPNIG